MQFMLLLPELPRAQYGALLHRDVSDARSSAVPADRAFVVRVAHALWRRLGFFHRRPVRVASRLA